jgi:hypothetical protein
MWIVLRLVFAALGFVARQLIRPRRLRAGTPAGEHAGIPYYVAKKPDKKHPLRWLGMRVSAPAPIRIHDQEPLDRIRGHIAVAAATADSPQTLYLTTHHPLMGELLNDNAELRAAVLEAFERGHELHYDGEFVWLRNFDREPSAVDALLKRSERELDALAAVYRASAPLERDVRRGARYSYLWKTLVVEGIIWAFAGYALGGAVELIATGKESIHLTRAPITFVGLVIAVILFLGVLALAVFWLRGATRGYDAFLTHAFLLFVLPVVGVYVASDLNRGLDTSTPFVRTGVAERCQEKRAKGGSVYTLTMKQREAPIPDEVSVVKEICDSVSGPTPVTFTIGKGFLGLPWYRATSTPSAEWSP